MTSAFDFNAPQFLDLRDNDIARAEAEKFFEETNEENALTKLDKSPRRVTFNITSENDENNDPQFSKYSLGSRVQTPAARKSIRDVDSDDGLLEGIEQLNIDSKKKSNKNRSSRLPDGPENVALDPESAKKCRSRTPLRTTQIFEGITLEPVSAKKHSMVTRSDAILRTPKLSLRSRDITKPAEDDDDENDDSMVTAISSTPMLGEFKRRSIQQPISEPDEDQPSKFIALAEQVANFHKETPDRYRTKPHNTWRPSIKPPMHYRPKTPMLAALHRNRAVHFPDREKREQMEYDEMQKHQIKAYPVNEKILKKPSLGLKAPVEIRPATRPVPFKLTQFKPKPVVEEEPFVFKAQPVPRKILQSPCGIPPKMVRPVTTPKTPHITMPMKVRVNSSGLLSQCSAGSTDCINRTTMVEPFSFEERDKTMLARKEEHIKKILEEEKKMCNSFKAQPIRGFSRQTPTKKPQPLERKNTTIVPFNLTKPAEKKLPESVTTPFKARPASVLNKRPFFPSYSGQGPPKIAEFKLKTAERAQERQKFEEKMLKQEEEYKKALEEQRLEKERKEAELTKQLRQQAEFKAKPIPQYKPFEVHPSKVQLTDPQSPTFLSGKSKKGEDK